MFILYETVLIGLTLLLSLLPSGVSAGGYSASCINVSLLTSPEGTAVQANCRKANQEDHYTYLPLNRCLANNNAVLRFTEGKGG
jgi:hypothetical protein